MICKNERHPRLYETQCQARAACLLQGLSSCTCQELRAPRSRVCHPAQCSLPVRDSGGRAEHPQSPDSLDQYSHFPTQLTSPLRSFAQQRALSHHAIGRFQINSILRKFPLKRDGGLRCSPKAQFLPRRGLAQELPSTQASAKQTEQVL